MFLSEMERFYSGTLYSHTVPVPNGNEIFPVLDSTTSTNVHYPNVMPNFHSLAPHQTMEYHYQQRNELNNLDNQALPHSLNNDSFNDVHPIGNMDYNIAPSTFNNVLSNDIYTQHHAHTEFVYYRQEHEITTLESNDFPDNMETASITNIEMSEEPSVVSEVNKDENFDFDLAEMRRNLFSRITYDTKKCTLEETYSESRFVGMLQYYTGCLDSKLKSHVIFEFKKTIFTKFNFRSKTK